MFISKIKSLFKFKELSKAKVKIASILLVGANCMNLISPMTVKAVDFSSQLSSNEALGSPLLNESTWEESDWNQWETVAFGVFLSNFPVPFLDDYNSSFQDNGSGSKGTGLNALKYGSGNDSQANKVLTNLLSLAIKDQAQPLANIKVRYHKIDDHFVDSLEGELTDDGADATLKDMFVTIGTGGDTEPHIDRVKLSDAYDVNGGDFMSAMGDMRSGVGDSSGVQTFDMFTFKEMVLPEFYITSGGSPYQVLDFRDGYDAQMFTLTLARVANTTYGETALSNAEKMMDSPIGFDVYGNICVQYEGKNIIVLPASANQHLTKEKQYNLLTSTMMTGSYIARSGDSLVNSFFTNKRNLTVPFIGNVVSSNLGSSLIYSSDDTDNLGKVVMYSDTDIFMYQQAKSMVSTDKDFSTALHDVAYYQKSSGYSTGDTVYQLVNGDSIANKIGVPFKIEVVGSEGKTTFVDSWLNKMSAADSANSKTVTNSVKASVFIANIFPTSPTKNVLNSMITSSGPAVLFGQGDKQYMGTGLRSRNAIGSYGKYYNYALKYLNSKESKSISGTGSSSWGVPTQAEFISRVRGAVTPAEVAQAVYSDVSPVTGDALTDDMPMSGLFKHWAVSESGFAKGKNYSDSKIANLRASDTYTNTGIFDVKNIVNNVQNLMNIQGVEEIQDNFVRTAAIYGFNSSAITASNVLNVVEGTEFASYTPYIYLTYLTFYGVVDGKSQFNPNIFTGDILARKGEDIAKDAVLSPDAKRELMENYMYNLLDPDNGGEYRQKLISNFMTEFLYDNYRKIVYGSTDNYIASSISSGGDEGFLRVNTMSENMFIGGLAKQYVKNFLIIFALLLLVSFVMAIFSGKGILKIIGITISFAVLMAMSPTLLDITPAICNRFVQDLFSSNMTYWAIAESIDSDRIDIDTESKNDKEVNTFVRMLNVSQYDKTILIKNDISKKVVETVPGVDLAKIQRMRTTRWIFPMLMRQFSANDGSADYVSVPLIDQYRNMHNLYWLYRSNDKIKLDLDNNTTFSAKLARDLGTGNVAGVSNSSDILELSDKQAIYGGYINTKTDTLDHHSISRFNSEDKDNAHTSFYLMNFGTKLTVPNPADFSELSADINETGLNKNTWGKYASYLATNGASSLGFMSNLNNITNEDILPTLGKYNSYNEPIYNYFGYLWMTENPMPYFYISVKDTFNADMSIGKLVYELQGYYSDILDDSGNVKVMKAHHTFMRDDRNGAIRDFLDMEEFFTNVLPYMYNVQIIAGGDGNNNGAFGDALIGDVYPYYAKNKKSWLFRSNWVTKIEEGDIYNKKDRIGYITEGGNKEFVNISGSLHPSSYSKYRPMVFSESQMIEMGLDKGDLSYTENQILKFNKDVEKEWTLLINYANSNGMKADTIYRQMALTATLKFSKYFSTSSAIDSRILYPNTLDLRNMSFDAVMKLVYMGATRNASVIYKDTMQVVIENGDIFGGIVLLLDAIMCSKLIPMVRDFGLAFVTLLLVFKLILDVMLQQDGKNKYLLGALLIYLKCAVFTLMFYLIFKFIMLASTPSQVLSDSSLTGTGHNAWWYNLIILFACLGYTFLLGNNIIRFTWINRKDMGLEASLNSLGAIATGITGGFGGLSDVIGNYFGGVGSSLSSESSLSDNSSSSVKATSVEISDNYRNNGDSNTDYDKKNSNSSIDTFLDAVSSSNKDKEIKNSGWGSKDIDSSISRGEEKQSEVKSKED